MKSTTFIVTMLVALTLIVTACAPAATPTQAMPAATAVSGSSSGSSMPAATMVPPLTPAGGAAVNLGSSSKYSSFLVGGNGMSLYLYTKDSPGVSTCYDKCATAWPPLLTNGKPVSGTGVDMSKFGTLTRKDNTVQVTYNGWPLYYYAKDKQAGDTNGEGVGSVWYLVSPTGDKVGG